MNKFFKQMFIVLCLFAAPLGMYAQTLVFHLAGGAKTTVTLPATFTVTPSGDKLVIAVGSDNIELAKDEIMWVTYRDAKGDVNGDMRVDVADVSTLVGIVIGKNEPSYLTCPDDHHPHLIDLGLPSGTKWACCNVGASAPEQYGGYYAWGETEEKDLYNWSTYAHYDGSSDNCYDIGSDIAGTDYDVAHVKWGGSWVMPSHEQIIELIEETTSEVMMQNGVNGCKFTSSNGGTIFLPGAGAQGENGNSWEGTGGYWSSEIYGEKHALDLHFYNSGSAHHNSASRFLGRSVRPVHKN